MTLIPIKDCIKARLYKIKCRNMTYGVWNGENGFIGIRCKFGKRFLFTEYHWEAGPPYGTVYETVDTGIDLPIHKGYELRHYAPSVDEKSKRPCEFRPDDTNTTSPGKWYFKDTGEPGAKPCSYVYAPLFDWLERNIDEYEKSEPNRRWTAFEILCRKAASSWTNRRH